MRQNETSPHERSRTRSTHHHGCAEERRSLLDTALRLRRDARAIPLGFIHSDPEFIMAFSVCAIERSGRYTTTRVLGKAPNTTPNTGAGEAGTWHDENTPAWFKRNVQSETSSRARYKPLPRASSFLTKIEPPRRSLWYRLIKNIPWAYLQGSRVTFWRVTKIPFRRDGRCAVAGDCGWCGKRERESWGRDGNSFLPRNIKKKNIFLTIASFLWILKFFFLHRGIKNKVTFFEEEETFF